MFAGPAAAQTEQHTTQEQEASREPGEQSEVKVPMPLPVARSQEDREALCQHNAERYDWLEHLGAQDRSVCIPWYQRVADLRMSTTNPDASLMEALAMIYLIHLVRCRQRFHQRWNSSRFSGQGGERLAYRGKQSGTLTWLRLEPRRH